MINPPIVLLKEGTDTSQGMSMEATFLVWNRKRMFDITTWVIETILAFVHIFVTR